MPAANPLLLLASFFALYFIWGSTYFAIRVGVETWPPLLMAGVRFLIAGTLIYAWCRARGVANPSLREWRAGSIVGVLLLAVGNGGVTIAEHMGVASGVAALSVATVPLFALLFGMCWGQRTKGFEWAGIALGIVGIGLLNLGSNLQASPAGAVILLVAAASWALGSIWSKYLSMPKGAMSSAVGMLAGGGVLLSASLLSGERLDHMPSREGWLALAYLVVFGSIVAFSAYVYLLKHVRPAAATSYAYVNPVVAVMLGVGFAGEQVGFEELIAMMIIVSAVVLINLPQRRSPKLAESC
jgi:drug/metabolite transporter (DMT)-like permease